MASEPGLLYRSVLGGTYSVIDVDSTSATASIGKKRPMPSSTDDVEDATQRKRFKDTNETCWEREDNKASTTIDGEALASDLAQELQCPCCSALVYKPVTILPCDHISCGSCLTLWIKNGGTACPACRSVSTAVVPSRSIQSIVNVLLRASPHLQRTERERMQADEVYPILRAFRIPTPRVPSPEPTIPPTTEFHQPCPTCTPGNAYNWTCPTPIPNPSTDPGNALRKDDGVPQGHGLCGNCESLLCLRAPMTSRCDFCQVSFCGISVQSRCVALGLLVQSPGGFSDLGDLVQSGDVYEMFDGNTTEAEIMIEYMEAHCISPKQVYRQIATHIQTQREGFQPLFDEGIFSEIHNVPAGIDPDPSAPRRYICRVCATEVFLYGLRDWWIRERRKAIKDGVFPQKPNCISGRACESLNDPAHAREYDHLIASEEPANPTGAEPTSALNADNSSQTSFAHSPFLSLSSLPRLADLDTPLPPLPENPIASYLANSSLNVVSSRFTMPVSDSNSNSNETGPSLWDMENRPNLSSAVRIADLFGPREPPVPESATGSGNHASRNSEDTFEYGGREPPSDQSQESVEAMLAAEPHGPAVRDRKGKAPASIAFDSFTGAQGDERYYTYRPSPVSETGAGPSLTFERARSPLKTSGTDDLNPHYNRPSHLTQASALKFFSPLRGPSSSAASGGSIPNTHSLQIG